MHKKLFLLVVFLYFVSSCITVGKQFQTGSIPGITIGKTTQKDLETSYGKPYRQGVDDGDLTWTYLYYKLNLVGEKYTRDLYIRFDKAGTVKSYSYNTNFPDEEIKIK
ncbi:MAG: hypothetical protein A2252_00070 [Elusimicrobia bacterium RIFOXYA2_FULL_39_19]|nr:MAG: hypothetical protein A2252_00070 [Elusimicrobia bacterium RIFOXYA2_FULL_39_19]